MEINSKFEYTLPKNRLTDIAASGYDFMGDNWMKANYYYRRLKKQNGWLCLYLRFIDEKDVGISSKNNICWSKLNNQGTLAGMNVW